MLIGVALPTLALMGLAVLVGRLVERAMPETLFGLGLGFAISCVILWGLASLGFGAAYLWRGVAVAALLGPQAGVPHLMGLAAKSALIWAPILALVTITAPRRWKTAVW
ncbi:MAG: hypothetical protein N4A53_09645 [Pelagimonas sp.]|jgi:hypothetical protein|nr:hypothetical protein [Pelagimonas sp.]